MKSVEAIIFDCDGLLLDTEEVWIRAEAALFAEHGREFTEEDRKAMAGASVEDLGRLLAGVLDQPGREDELATRLLDKCVEAMTSEPRPMSEAVELVRELRRRERAPLGVASNSPRELVEKALKAAGLEGFFDVILGADDVSKPKPDPEIYRLACTRLDARTSHSIALEDSPTGAAAARAAGLYVIAVPSMPGTLPEADTLADSLNSPLVREALFPR